MPEYLVTWSVDVEADNPLHAAFMAAGELDGRDAYAQVYEVVEHGTPAYCVAKAAGELAIQIDMERESTEDPSPYAHLVK